MKNLLIAFTLLVTACTSATAISIQTIGFSESNLGNVSQMPGSPTDFTMFGSQTQFSGAGEDGGAGGQPTVLTDFSVALSGSSEVWGGDSGRYSTINDPTGTAFQTGILFDRGPDANQVTFTLGTPGSNFDFSNFTVYLMYGNGEGDGSVRDTDLFASVFSPSAALLGSVDASVSDTNSSSADLGLASIEAITITGARAGDTLEIGSSSATGIDYLGGVSFAEVPEPSTYALLGLGMLVLVFAPRVVRQRLATC